MIVYVVIEEYAYEGDSIVGIYENINDARDMIRKCEEKAKDCKRKDLDYRYEEWEVE